MDVVALPIMMVVEVRPSVISGKVVFLFLCDVVHSASKRFFVDLHFIVPKGQDLLRMYGYQINIAPFQHPA